MFNKGTISYWQQFILSRSDRWYHDKLASLQSDKYLDVTHDKEGNIFVTRTQDDPSESYELMTVPLSAFTKEGCALPHLLMLAIFRDCLSNKKIPWSRKKFMRYFRVDLSTIKRYLRFLIGQGLVAPYTWKKYKPLQEEEFSDDECFSALNVYSIKNKPQYLYRYKATKKAVININDWPLLSENDICDLLRECAASEKNIITQESFGNFCPPIHIKGFAQMKDGFHRGGGTDGPPSLRSRDPIFSQIINSLTNLSARGYEFGERWSHEPEVWRAARWLARQEGVTVARVRAWESKLATHSFLKSVLRDGWKAAIEGDYAKKGGDVWDKSSHLGKYRDQGWRAKNLIYRFADILQGKYDRQELSSKAKGRVWGEDGCHPAPNTPVKRTEVPAEWFNGYLERVSATEDLRPLLKRLWKKCGWSTYETLIDPCEIMKNDEGRWVLMPPNRFHAKLLEEKLKLHWWRVVLPTTNNPVRYKLRESYDAWLKENPQEQAPQEEKEDDDARAVTENSTSNQDEKGGQEMGIVPANDDEGVIPAYVDDDAPHQNGQMPPHMGGRKKGQNLADHGRESEEALLRDRKERQELLLQHLSSCTNLHASEKMLRIDTITRHGINAYNRWFNRCRIDIVEGVARYVAPNDFMAVEIERRYGVQLNTQEK